MENMNVAPIDHGIASASVTTVSEAGRGTFNGFKTGGLWVGLASAVGFGVAAFSGVGALGLIALGIAGIGATLFSAGAGSVIGAAKGTYNGVNRVRQEQGAANVMQAQVAAYQAQAIAAANDNKYNFPAQGSQFNEAGSTVNAMRTDGRVNGMQLQRA